MILCLKKRKIDILFSTYPLRKLTARSRKPQNLLYTTPNSLPLYPSVVMTVSPELPFRLIYSLYQHEYLGYLFESFIVQADEHGQLTLKHQNISSRNAEEFSKDMNENDYKIIQLIDDVSQDHIAKHFSTKKISTADFFIKTYDNEKGDKVLQQLITDYVEEHKSQMLDLMQGKLLYEMGKDGEPAWRKLTMASEKGNIEFHVERWEDHTVYYPVVTYKGNRFSFYRKETAIICRKPAWVVVDSVIYTFDQYVDGNKIKPFLGKRQIIIPQEKEDQYYRRFVSQMVASFDVHASGFEIENIEEAPQAVLHVSEVSQKTEKKEPVLVSETSQKSTNETEAFDNKLLFDLHFKYKGHTFAAALNNTTHVILEKKDDDFIFHKIIRNIQQEDQIISYLEEKGLSLKEGRTLQDRTKALNWLVSQKQKIKEQGISLVQHTDHTLIKGEIVLEITEERDWFDVKAKVRFGEYEIPFIRLREYILAGQKEFTLPNGRKALIPEEWFVQYADLLHLSQKHEDEVRLKKMYMSLVDDMKQNQLAQVSISRKLEALRQFDEIEDAPMPENFKGQLRPYQKAGYNWMNFLSKYKFGGCLADDMGLGKTVQTLALLQKEREKQNGTSLLIVPTSLTYNWEKEAAKFTSSLQTFTYIGSNRKKDIDSYFGQYDVIITSYGITRVDIDLLKNYAFNYVILDESQAIKNPSSIISKAVQKLKSRQRLILTGTPLENSTLDLWSQINFINPGLLGTRSFFKKEFQFPIEKKNDELKIQRLHSLIKPFILRRQKGQVATDLPPKVEHLQYCDMTREQNKAYEEAKSYYRNQILEMIQDQSVNKSQLVILQGLTRLRQIANHPAMADAEYTGNSGKLEDITHKLSDLIGHKHKVLIFSQFVKHLKIIEKMLKEQNIAYNYLDGSTRNRQQEVESFQNNPDIPVFLISLKAGGTGLNLTAADYVFIMDPWWNPAVEEQAINRAHRIGQDKHVFIYRFITRNTVEEKITALQENKRRLANDLITTEEKFMKSLSHDDILELLD